MPERHGRTFLGRAIKRQADAHMKPRSNFSSQCTTPDHYTRSNDDTITDPAARVANGAGHPNGGLHVSTCQNSSAERCPLPVVSTYALHKNSTRQRRQRSGTSLTLGR